MISCIDPVMVVLSLVAPLSTLGVHLEEHIGTPIFQAQ